jgi:hypothetical protein
MHVLWVPSTRKVVEREVDALQSLILAECADKNVEVAHFNSTFLKD